MHKNSYMLVSWTVFENFFWINLIFFRIIAILLRKPFVIQWFCRIFQNTNVFWFISKIVGDFLRFFLFFLMLYALIIFILRYFRRLEFVCLLFGNLSVFSLLLPDHFFDKLHRICILVDFYVTLFFLVTFWPFQIWYDQKFFVSYELFLLFLISGHHWLVSDAVAYMK